jgi:hypothetical protein
MTYKERIVDLLKENMSERCFKLWQIIDTRLPNAWDKPTSSTGKHHKKLNGKIPSQAEHVYHLLYSIVKIFRMFDVERNTTDLDKLLLAAVLHDSLKYGQNGVNPHTDNSHDKKAADLVIAQHKETFLKLLTEEQFYILEEAVRFHSGRWSSDVPKNKKFTFKDYNPETLFLHMLDMMSTADLIQTDVRD